MATKIKILLGGLALFLIYILSKMKKENTNSPIIDTTKDREFSEQQLRKAFSTVALYYGWNFAKKLEQLYRIETAHFTSLQFRRTFSPGMEIAGGTNSNKTEFPFGWTGLQTFVNKFPTFNGNFYTYRMPENKTGIPKTFVGFPHLEASIMFTAYFIAEIRNGRFGYWYSLDPISARSYENKLNTITTKFT